MTADEIRQHIESAFAAVPYPGDHQISYDTSGHHLECAQVAEFFRGKHWQQLTLHDLRDNYRGDESACLCFMSPEAYRFYLPAYMLFSLDPESLGHVIRDAAFYSLTPPDDANQRAWWQRRASVLDAAQCRAVLGYLQLLSFDPTSDYHTAELQRAINYWSHEVA